jgi:hypothetical protein
VTGAPGFGDWNFQIGLTLGAPCGVECENPARWRLICSSLHSMLDNMGYGLRLYWLDD